MEVLAQPSTEKAGMKEDLFQFFEKFEKAKQTVYCSQMETFADLILLNCFISSSPKEELQKILHEYNHAASIIMAEYMDSANSDNKADKDGMQAALLRSQYWRTIIEKAIMDTDVQKPFDTP